MCDYLVIWCLAGGAHAWTALLSHQRRFIAIWHNKILSKKTPEPILTFCLRHNFVWFDCDGDKFDSALFYLWTNATVEHTQTPTYWELNTNMNIKTKSRQNPRRSITKATIFRNVDTKDSRRRLNECDHVHCFCVTLTLVRLASHTHTHTYTHSFTE